MAPANVNVVADVVADVVINDPRLRELHAEFSTLVASGLRNVDCCFFIDGQWYSMAFAPKPLLNPGYESIPSGGPSVSDPPPRD